MKFNKKYLLSILSIFLGLLICEGVFRLWGPNYHGVYSVDKYRTNPRDYYEMLYRKNNSNPVYGLQYKKNEEGYRIPNKRYGYSQPKKGDYNYNILGVGDSFTWGQGVKYKDIYLTVLKQHLNNRMGFKGSNKTSYGIKNAGKRSAGFGQVQDIWDIYSQEMNKSNYSLAIYGFVLNDFGLPNPDKIYGNNFIDMNNGGYSYNRWRDLSAFYNYIMYVKDMKRLNTVTKNAYLNSFKKEYNNIDEKFGKIKRMDELAKSKNTTFVLVIFPLLYRLNENYPFKIIHGKVENYCKENDILVLDLLDSFKKYEANELWASPMDKHPNEIAHRAAGRDIYNFLKNEKLINVNHSESK